MTLLPLKVGDRAPSFGSWEFQGQKCTAQDILGKWIVLYFYPKDNTSGCTKEAQDFKELWPAFTRLNCVILGVSKDSYISHKNFSHSLALPFPLISDSTGKICEEFGTWGEKSMYGRTYFGINRSTFLLNPEGTIVHMWRKVKVPNHAQEVLTTLQKNLT